MILYHGTDEKSAKDILMNGVNLTKSKKYLDFGPGFYLSQSFDSAVRWAKRRSFYSDPYVVSVDFDFETAKQQRMVRLFDTCDIQWAQFILNNRCGIKYIRKVELKDNNLNAVYPIVVGKIADGDIFEVVKRFRASHELVTEEVVKELYEHSYPVQYSLHTPEALELIKSIRIRKVL